MMRIAAVCACALLTSGCLDFFEPDLPQRATPAVVQASVRAFDQGVLQVDGSLQPGRDSTGFQRVVQSPFIQANEHTVQPSSLGDRGLRLYNTSFGASRGDTGGPFFITLPDVRDVAPLPQVRWNGLLRADPDTVDAERGADIVLRMDTLAVVSTPEPFRQWFLEVRAGSRSFRISSDGLPPLTLRIPPSFIPPTTDPFATVSLIYLQSSSVRNPVGDYLGNVNLDIRLNWVIRFTDTP